MTKPHACSVCGAESHTLVSWPRFRVRNHWRCDKCWQHWWLMTAFMDRWFGLSGPFYEMAS